MAETSSSGLRKMTPTETANRQAALDNQGSSSGLRQMTPSETAKIQEARDAQYGAGNTPAPALIPNPRTTTNANGVEQQTPPTSPAVGGNTSESPTQPDQSSTVPTSETTKIPQMLDTAEKASVIKAMGGFTSTMEGFWEQMQRMSKSMTGMNTNQLGQVGPTDGQPTPNPRGQEPGYDQNGAENPTTAALTPEQAGGVKMPGAEGTMDLFQSSPEYMNPKPTTNVVKTPDQIALDNASDVNISKSPNGVPLSVGQSAVQNILADPMSATNVSPGLDPYTQIAQDIAAQVMDGLDATDESLTKMIEISKKRAESASEAEKSEMARVTEDYDIMAERSRLDAENAKASTGFERDKQVRRGEENLAVMEDKNSRLFGFLKAKLAKMGALDSAAGLDSLAKTMALSSMDLRHAGEDLRDYSSMMLMKEEEIMLKYGQQAVDIERAKNKDIDTIRKTTEETLMNIEQNILSTEIQKVQARTQAIKELGTMEMQARSMAVQENNSMRSMALQESEFSYSQLRDKVSDQQWTKQFDQQISQFNHEKDMNLTSQTGYLHFGGEVAVDPVTKLPIKNLDMKQYDSQVDSWLTQAMGTLYKNKEDTGKVTFVREQFARGILESDRNYDRGIVESDRGYNMDVATYGTSTTGNIYNPKTGEYVGGRTMNGQEFDFSMAKNEFGFALEKVNAGISDPSSLNKFKDAYDIMSGGVYVGGDENNTLGGKFANALKLAAKNLTNKAFQCVQFGRGIAPNLPGNLNSLQDKIDILLTNNKNSIPAPVPGATIVMDTGTWTGHIATVMGINKEKNTMSIIEHNVKTDANGNGIASMREVALSGNKSIKGYWLDPTFRDQKTPPKMAATPKETVEALKNLPAEQQKQYYSDGLNAGSMANSLARFESWQGGNPGLWNRQVEGLMTIANLQKDPKYTDLMQDVFLPIQQVRKDLYGTAQSAGEEVMAALALPSDDETVNDMIGKVEKIQQYMRSRQSMTVDMGRGITPPVGANGMVERKNSDGTIDMLDPETWRQMLYARSGS